MMEGEMDQAPDLIGPVVAYRAWRVADKPVGTRLRSMASAHPIAWNPGEEMRANCLGLRVAGPRHNAPNPACLCGFYVMHTLDDLLAEPTQVAHLLVGWGTAAVAGEVEVWGRSERYQRGRRVEWCRVRALYDTPLAGTVDVDALAGAYGVPVLDDPDGKIAGWRQERPQGSGRYWQWAGYRAGAIAYTGHASYHAHTPPPKATDVMDDPDKPIPGPRKDHLRLTSQHRSPRSITKKGVRNV